MENPVKEVLAIKKTIIKKPQKGGAEKLRLKNKELLRQSASQCIDISNFFSKNKTSVKTIVIDQNIDGILKND